MATRQNISLTEPSDQFLSALANKESGIKATQVFLIEAEKSIEKHGYSKKSPEQRLADFKEKARQHGRL